MALGTTIALLDATTRRMLAAAETMAQTLASLRTIEAGDPVTIVEGQRSLAAIAAATEVLTRSLAEIAVLMDGRLPSADAPATEGAGPAPGCQDG